MRDMGSWSLEGWRLEFKWRKEWFDWELSVVEEFLNVLTNVNIASQASGFNEEAISQLMCVPG